MTNDESKKPFYRNPAWIRCVVIGEMVVFGSMIIRLVYFGDIAYIFTSPLRIVPMFFWQIFLRSFYPGDGDAVMLYLGPMIATIVLWWIFLGAVLGTVIYRVRLYLQRKSSNP